MRLAGTKLAANHQYRGFGDQLYDLSGQLPSLDLNFAANKSLTDSASGQNLVTFTRASSGTFVGSDGVIKTATTNVFTYSEDAQTAWSVKSGMMTPFAADTIVAPDGQTTADEVIENTGTGGHYIERNVGLPGNAQWTYSVYVKRKGSARGIWLNLYANSYADNLRGSYNLSTLATSVANGGGASGATASIVPVGDGWFRLILSGTPSTSSTADIKPRLSFINESTIYTGDGTSGIYIWGAQLEQSSTVGEYIPTTGTINSAPRFDHNPTTGESLGLLVEEQRTNLQLRSEEFNETAVWVQNAVGTVTANSIAAPNGQVTADTLAEDTTTAGHGYLDASASVVSGTTYTFSVYLKAGTATIAQLTGRATSFGAANNWANYDLVNGVVGAKGSTTTASIQSVGNGWYRCVATCAATSTTTGGFAISFVDNDINAGRFPSYTATNKNLYAWGAQLEAGSFPTSYIPTTTATVTRSADVASISGSNFSGWYRADEGTLYAEGSVPVGVSSARALASISDGTNNERIIIGQNGTTATSGLVVDDNVVQVTGFNGGTNTFPPGERRKLALAYKIDDFGFTTVPGTTTAQDSSGTVPTVDRLQIGNAPGRTEPNQPIQRLVFWPRRLGNEVLQGITQ
jgi:hypothetical protein